MPWPGDVLAGASWQAVGTPPSVVVEPAQLPPDGPPWIPAPVPGTVAAALRGAGRWSWSEPDEDLLDRQDWWYRTTATVPAAGRWHLVAEGLATVAEVWVGDEQVAATRSMWRPCRAEVELAAGTVVIAIRLAALPDVGGRPRARWRTALLREPSLRWLRTSLAGRIPGVSEGAAAVGPWRPVRLVPASAPPPEVALLPRLEGGVGHLEVEVTGVGAHDVCEVRCSGRHLVVEGGGRRAGTLVLDGIEPWWPHTHGAPTRHAVEVAVGGAVVARRLVGFRSVVLDPGAPHPLTVNGRPCFVRGALWALPDQVALDGSAAALRPSLELVRASGANTVRVPGTAQYPPAAFWELCDELGLLVWQDCMLAGFDPPADPAWEADLAAEVREHVGPALGHPSLAVVVGSNEAYQRAAMFGLPIGSWRSRALEEVVPGALGPGVPYLPSTPTGADLPFHPGGGVAHYFGVGAYRRSLDDPALAGVSLAAECLAFATPPEPATVRSLRAAGGGLWRAGTPRDPGADWDFTDVTDHYVATLLGGHGSTPADRAGGAAVPDDRALDLRRAAVCRAVAATFGRWRSPTSPCGGGLVLTWQDRRPGPGWGLVDEGGAPKAPWWVLRRLWAPRAVWWVDEGLGGLAVHVANDGPAALTGELRVRAVDGAGVTTVEGAVDLLLPPGAVGRWSDAAVVGAFRDLNGAYAFGPPAHVAVVAEVVVDGRVAARDVHLPAWVDQAERAQRGLRAVVVASPEGWVLEVATEAGLAWVAADLEGWRPEDHWFHLEPGGSRTVPLRRVAGGPPVPAGTVRALNASDQVAATS